MSFKLLIIYLTSLYFLCYVVYSSSFLIQVSFFCVCSKKEMSSIDCLICLQMLATKDDTRRIPGVSDLVHCKLVEKVWEDHMMLCSKLSTDNQMLQPGMRSKCAISNEYTERKPLDLLLCLVQITDLCHLRAWSLTSIFLLRQLWGIA